MARRRQSDFLFFNAKGYMQALRKNLEIASKEIRDLVHEKARQNAESLPFKDSKVALVSGITSDAARKTALFNSIVASNLDYQAAKISDSLASSLPTGTINYSVSAMGSNGNYKDSHIGIYYEYGTGQGMDVGSLKNLPISLGDNNPHRDLISDKPIVTRGGNKSTNDRWTDAGGNLRVSKGPGGERGDVFVKQIGDYVEAEHWFRKAYESVKDEARDKFRIAVKDVDLMVYLTHKSAVHLSKK